MGPCVLRTMQDISYFKRILGNKSLTWTSKSTQWLETIGRREHTLQTMRFTSLIWACLSTHWGWTPIYPPGMWWVHGGLRNKIPRMDPPGPFWLFLQFAPNLPPQIPTRYMLSIFKKYPAQNPLRVVLIYPLGSFWLILQFAHNSLTQIPTGHMLSIFTKYPPRYPPIDGLGTVVSSSRVCLKSTHYVIKMYPVGIYQRTHKELTMQLNFTTNPQRTHQIPTGYILIT